MTTVPSNLSDVQARRERWLDYSFLIGIALKILNIIGDFLAGIPLLFIQPHQIKHLGQWLAADGLADNPHDPIANLIINATIHVNSGTLLYFAIYLLIHGLVKLGIIIALIRGSHRVYPWAIAALGALLLYQVIDILVKFSTTMVILSILDSIIIWLTWREWKHHRTLQDVLMRYAPKMAQRWPFEHHSKST